MNESIERLAKVLQKDSPAWRPAEWERLPESVQNSFLDTARAAYLHVLRELCGSMCSYCGEGIESDGDGVWHTLPDKTVPCYAGHVARRLWELEKGDSP